ncbi:MAG TPA: 3-oxoacyl-ACP reductase family protein [Blastocatellia bacterium]|nr:3-oxoacyl-ACP reductase family protein [Blastocatellia bacterium]
MSLLLEGKKALITGGSRGLGKAICEIFAREGAEVAFNYSSSESEADKTVDLIKKYGSRALAFMVSVTDRLGVRKMVHQIIEEFGRIDILVNNAAVNRGDSFVTMTERAWDTVVDTNINGLFNVTKPVFKQMVRQRAGKILNISSIGALRALPTSVHYATTKAAVNGFTKCLSREAANFGISVNAIAAGIFDTDLGQTLPEHFKQTYLSWCAAGRFGHPSELAEFAAFMASDRNSYMTGEIVVVDGGTIT